MADNATLDSQISEAAKFFSGELHGATDVAIPEKLERKKLDYSLTSLEAVSSWLNGLREKGINTNSEGIAESIIWAGAYVGEVIKRCTSETYIWIGYEDYMSTQKESLRNMIPYTFGTQFLLVSQSGSMTMPINKVVRFLEEGPENDLKFYASAECKRKK